MRSRSWTRYDWIRYDWIRFGGALFDRYGSPTQCAVARAVMRTERLRATMRPYGYIV